MEDIRDRILTEDGAVINDPNRERIRQRNRKIVATTEDREQRDRIGRKEALIERHGEKKYDELVRKSGGKILGG